MSIAETMRSKRPHFLAGQVVLKKSWRKKRNRGGGPGKHTAGIMRTLGATSIHQGVHSPSHEKNDNSVPASDRNERPIKNAYLVLGMDCVAANYGYT